MKRGHSGVCGASYIVEVLSIVPIHSNMRIQQECLRKDMVHTLVFASTLFIITGLQASFHCHGVCYYIMLEHALLALSMYIGIVLQYIQPGIALFILMCISHCIIFILYQGVVCIIYIYGFGKAH